MSFHALVMRPHGYTLSVSDLGAYTCDPDDPGSEDSAAVEFNDAPKLTPLSRHVLLAGGAHAGLLNELRARLSNRVRPDADYDDCLAVARDVVIEMRTEQADRPNVPSWLGIETGGLVFMLAGFKRDGSAGIAAFQSGGRTEAIRQAAPDGWEVVDVKPSGGVVSTVPYGVPIDDEALARFETMTDAPESCADALRHVFESWTALYASHPDRITSQMRGLLILWGGDGSQVVEFECDTGDAESFASLYAQLRLIEAIHAAESALDPDDLELANSVLSDLAKLETA